MFGKKSKLKLMKNLKASYRQLQGQYNFYKNSIYYTTGDEFVIYREVTAQIDKLQEIAIKIKKEMDKNRRI